MQGTSKRPHNVHVNSSTVHHLNNMNKTFTRPDLDLRKKVLSQPQLKNIFRFTTRICFSYYKEKEQGLIISWGWGEGPHKYFILKKQHAPWICLKSEYSG